MGRAIVRRVGLKLGLLGFQGGMTDAYTGYVKFGRRDYDPTEQRWLQQDPSGAGAG